MDDMLILGMFIGKFQAELLALYYHNYNNNRERKKFKKWKGLFIAKDVEL